MEDVDGSGTAPSSSPANQKLADDANLTGEEAACLRLFLPWVLEKHDAEHVSFDAFVKKFELSVLESAQQYYETLLTSSQLRALRRRSLLAEYEIFKEHYLQRFWLNYQLDMEKNNEKATLDIALTKTAMVIRSGSVSKTTRTMKLLEDGNYDATPKDTKTQAKVDDEGHTSKKRSLKAVANNNLQGTCDTVANTSSSREPKLHVDVRLARPVTTLTGFDVGTAFRQLQKKAVALVNGESYKVSIKNMHLMLSANSIWDTGEPLPGMSDATL
ncbi:hypothetical protein B0O80DRAFT_487650 [Mortierella sp. GBAus27b]|nr:hypothetical protein B0O80DRAFT_487650 [Mortierella sp. GBAus27b]